MSASESITLITAVEAQAFIPLHERTLHFLSTKESQHGEVLRQPITLSEVFFTNGRKEGTALMSSSLHDYMSVHTFPRYLRKAMGPILLSHCFAGAHILAAQHALQQSQNANCPLCAPGPHWHKEWPLWSL